MRLVKELLGILRRDSVAQRLPHMGVLCRTLVLGDTG